MDNLKKFNQPAIIKNIFKPFNNEDIRQLPDNVEKVLFHLDDGEKVACYLQHFSAESPVLLYFPAENESFTSFAQRLKMFREFEFNLLFVAYRNHDNEDIEDALPVIFDNGVKIIADIKKYLDDKNYNSDIFVMGRSLGSFCAVEAALRFSGFIKGMIIESGINSFPVYLKSLGININQPDISERDGFDTLTKMEMIKLPTIIFHGAADDLIPVGQAEKIQSFSGARSKQFFIIPSADRWNIAEVGGKLFYQTIKKFTDTIRGVNTWRKKRKKYCIKEKG